VAAGILTGKTLVPDVKKLKEELIETVSPI
jgi:hypothetical protein